MEDDTPFFDKERNKLAAEITSGFEELLSSSNNLNRKIEEVLGMTREYETIAELWNSFHNLMRGHDDDETSGEAEQPPHGLPGTGGHFLTASKAGGTGATHEEQQES